MAKKSAAQKDSKSTSKKVSKKSSSEASAKSKPSKGDLGSLAKLMKGLDICMMTTVSEDGSMVSRPMSNNGDVEYDGTSYYFTYGDAGVVAELKANKSVNLAFEGDSKTYVSVAGKAKLVTKRDQMEDHWNPDLEKWFEDGLETEGITMIEVNAKRIKYWHELEEFELKV